MLSICLLGPSALVLALVAVSRLASFATLRQSRGLYSRVRGRAHSGGSKGAHSGHALIYSSLGRRSRRIYKLRVLLEGIVGASAKEG